MEKFTSAVRETSVSPYNAASQSDSAVMVTNQLVNSYAYDLTDSYSDAVLPQMVEILTVYASGVRAWADERGLIISAPKSTMTLFNAQSSN